MARFAGARRGGIVPMAAAGVPLVAVLAIAATELTALNSDKTAMQDVADQVALDGANQLTLANTVGITERVETSALHALEELAARSELTVSAKILGENTAVQVSMVSRRTSFFGNLLPPGGFVTTAQATAIKMPTMPLCVLAHADDSNTVRLEDSSALAAPGCLVHSNKEVRVDPGAKLTAALVQSVGTAEGAINPEALVGAGEVKDPFLTMPIVPKGTRCDDNKPRGPDPNRIQLKPGTYCQPILVGSGQHIILSRGEYWFTTGSLTLSGNAQMTGLGATLFFGKDAKLDIKDEARVSLEGPRTGPWAGFLLVATRDNTNDFVIAGDNVDRLLGAVYLPSARLTIEGDAPVAEDSDWTIVIAKAVQLKGSSRLIVNSDFATSSVPAPPGAGDNFVTKGVVRLVE
ncbi:MAG: hypothetical protein KY446_11995 [Proteobacteria bacterium]|nr:hypothetical protein [Pseudomonadota bacterium]